MDARIAIAWNAGGASINPRDPGWLREYYKQSDADVRAVQARFLGRAIDAHEGWASGGSFGQGKGLVQR